MNKEQPVQQIPEEFNNLFYSCLHAELKLVHDKWTPADATTRYGDSLTDFRAGAYWAYHLLCSEPLCRWVKIEKGCEMPKVGKFVLWHREDGNLFVCEIDKDDYDWWNGRQTKDPLKDGYHVRIYGTKCTHWSEDNTSHPFI